jgi:hypothetical protein
MHIGLIDIDSHNFPNLCLMKLSSWYKKQDDVVDLLKPEDVLLGQNMFNPYAKLYGAAVFNGHEKLIASLSSIGVRIAGSGSGKMTTLPDYIEHIVPDYSLYGIKNEAYGFLTRGCPRACPFCIVADKEGKVSHKVANLNEFWDGQSHIKLLDPNLLACADHMDLLNQLAESQAWVDFTQGLDARLLNDENIALLNKIKVKTIHFAWDNPMDMNIPDILCQFSIRSTIKDFRKLRVYVLCNYWSTHEQDLYRVYWLRDHGYDPYIMIYNKSQAPTPTRYLQRWVNNKRIFRSIPQFEDYDHLVG